MSSNYTDNGGCWGTRAPIIQQYILAILSGIFDFKFRRLLSYSLSSIPVALKIWSESYNDVLKPFNSVIPYVFLKMWNIQWAFRT